MLSDLAVKEVVWEEVWSVVTEGFFLAAMTRWAVKAPASKIITKIILTVPEDQFPLRLNIKESQTSNEQYTK